MLLFPLALRIELLWLWLVTVVPAFMYFVVWSNKNWSCPACNSLFHKADHRIRFCPYCGIPLVETPLRDNFSDQSAMTPAGKLWIRYVICIAGAASLLVGCILFYQWDYRKLRVIDLIYQEVEHPSWSSRVVRKKVILVDRESNDQKVLYLVDVRRISVSLEHAIDYYRREADRLGLRDCHVDGYENARLKFRSDWDQMKLSAPPGGDVLFISQRFFANSSVFRNSLTER